MNLNWLSLDRLSIATRLLLWFLAISLIPCIILTLVNNYLSVRSLQRSLRSQLLSISSAKTTQLDNFIRERRGDAAVISQAPERSSRPTSWPRISPRDRSPSRLMRRRRSCSARPP